MLFTFPSTQRRVRTERVSPVVDSCSPGFGRRIHCDPLPPGETSRRGSGEGVFIYCPPFPSDSRSRDSASFAIALSDSEGFQVDRRGVLFWAESLRDFSAPSFKAQGMAVVAREGSAQRDSIARRIVRAFLRASKLSRLKNPFLPIHPSKVPHREQISVESSTRLIAPGKAPGFSLDGIIPPQIGQNGIALLVCSQVMEGDFVSHPPGE